MQIANVEGYIMDLDGTVMINSAEIILNFISDYIRQYHQLPLEFLKNFFKSHSAYCLEDAIKFFFYSFGIEDKITDFAKKLSNLTSYNNNECRLEDGFLNFTKVCREQNVPFYFFSKATKENVRFQSLIEMFGKELFLSWQHKPKSDPETFGKIAKEMKMDSKNWIYIDDSPLALWSAKQAGFITVMMLNSVYTEEDALWFDRCIDYKIRSFKELI